MRFLRHERGRGEPAKEPQGGERQLSKPRIEESLAQLRVQIQRLDQKYRLLRERDREYLEVCARSLREGDRERATIYANEVAEMRRIAGNVLHSQLVLEQVKLRLETIEEVGDVVALLSPLRSVINEVRGQVASVLPDASNVLEQLSSQIGSIMEESAPAVNEPEAAQRDPEAERILSEAAQATSTRLRESFPEIPSIVGGEVEELVYGYVRSAPSSFEVSACARNLGLTEREVVMALEGLQRRNLIVVEQREKEPA